MGDTPIDDIIPAHGLGMKTIWRQSQHPWPSGENEVFDEAVGTNNKLATALKRLIHGDRAEAINA